MKTTISKKELRDKVIDLIRNKTAIKSIEEKYFKELETTDIITNDSVVLSNVTSVSIKTETGEEIVFTDIDLNDIEDANSYALSICKKLQNS